MKLLNFSWFADVEDDVKPLEVSNLKGKILILKVFITIQRKKQNILEGSLTDYHCKSRRHADTQVPF
jgi:hypothetical protein